MESDMEKDMEMEVDQNENEMVQGSNSKKLVNEGEPSDAIQSNEGDLMGNPSPGLEKPEPAVLVKLSDDMDHHYYYCPYRVMLERKESFITYEEMENIFYLEKHPRPIPKRRGPKKYINKAKQRDNDTRALRDQFKKKEETFKRIQAKVKAADPETVEYIKERMATPAVKEFLEGVWETFNTLSGGFVKDCMCPEARIKDVVPDPSFHTAQTVETVNKPDGFIQHVVPDPSLHTAETVNKPDGFIQHVVPDPSLHTAETAETVNKPDGFIQHVVPDPSLHTAETAETVNKPEGTKRKLTAEEHAICEYYGVDLSETDSEDEVQK